MSEPSTDKSSVHLYPSTLFKDLEMDMVLHHIKQYAINLEAKTCIEQITPSYDVTIIHKNLTETTALKRLLQEGKRISIAQLDDITSILDGLSKPGYILDLEQLTSVAKVLRGAVELARFAHDHVLKEGALGDSFSPLLNVFDYATQVDRILDQNYNIRPDASPELLIVARQIEEAQKHLNRAFEQELQYYSSKGWLKDTRESIKNGFRVLAVKPEFKRQIPGLLLDESTSGQTFYIAPQNFIEQHNELQHLESKYQQEVYKILRFISEELRYHVNEIKLYYPAIIHLDILQAKARYAVRINGHTPKLTTKRMMRLIHCVHPVLLIKNIESNKNTIPFNLTLDINSRILLISGPNAGGKSIMMKAAGLAQVMTQSGILPPLDPSSELCLFQNIMVDIGDQQSIEEDLSTYSSHLQNMAKMIQYARHNTLLLLDEFGSGTDPVFGGALAESILYNFIKCRCFGIITTHYSNLKIFASKNKGITNGAMMFDKRKLTPTYQFKSGNPGSSFAFEIARKSGLPERVIRAARKKVGHSQTEVEDLLLQLRNEAAALQEQIQSYASKGQHLDRLIQQYDLLKHDLFIKKKKLNIQEQQLQLEFLTSKKAALKKLLKNLDEKANHEQTQNEIKKAEQLQKTATDALHQSIEEVYYKKGGAAAQLRVGDHVQLKIGGMKGVITSIKNRKASIDCEMFSLQAELKDLIQIEKPLQSTTTKSTRISLESRKSAFNNKLDLRGMSRSDALDVLQTFVDEALIANAFEITILHGKGNGILKLAVQQKLKEYSDVSKVFHPAPEQGGEGVTIVQF